MQEEQVHLRLIAEGYDGLFEILQGLREQILARRYVLKNLFAVGGQGILWLADDLKEPEKSVLIRIAMLPYHRPAYISEADIRRARQRMENEAQLLRLFKGKHFPQLYDLVYAPNLLYPLELGNQIIENEPYLVIEKIDGITLAKFISLSHLPLIHNEGLLQVQYDMRTAQKESWVSLAFIVAQVLLEFFEFLFQTGDGWLYADLTPKNLIFPKHGDTVLRVLDVGSAIPAIPKPNVEIPFSWEYIPPEYYEAYHNKIWRWPTQRFVLYALGKMLWHILTNRHPRPGEDPDLQDSDYPDELRMFIEALIKQEFEDFSSVAAALKQIKSVDMSTIKNVTGDFPCLPYPISNVALLKPAGRT